MSRLRRMSPRRSYDQYCSAARALDARRRPLDPADRPGAAGRAAALHRPARRPARRQHGRTRLPAEGHGARRPRDPAPAAAARSRVRLRTHRARARVAARTPGPGRVGAAELGERRPTDAVRAHWFALPLLRRCWKGRGWSKSGWRRGTSICTSARRTGRSTATGRRPVSPTPGWCWTPGRATAVRRGELGVRGAVRDGPGRGDRRRDTGQGAARDMRRAGPAVRCTYGGPVSVRPRRQAPGGTRDGRPAPRVSA